MRSATMLKFLSVGFLALLLAAAAAPAQRVTDGLLALYGFEEGQGATVLDVSGVGAALDLTIPDTTLVSWVPGGGLSVDAATLISSGGAATKIHDGVTASNAITIEAWVAPANLTQAGPARIVGMSETTALRDFTLGQGAGGQPATVYSFRLRTTTRGLNGVPELYTAAGSLTTDLTHVVYTRDAAGNAAIYLDNSEAVADTVMGDLSNWDDSMPLLLANEATEDRPWLGEYHLVAVYDKALSTAEINQNFLAGPSVGPIPPAIVAHPEDQTVAAGNTATFNVTAAGTPPLSYQWQRNTVDIGGAESNEYTTGPTVLGDEGDTFRCVVTNDQGNVTSNSATLHVFEPSAFVRIMPLGDSITYDNHTGDTRPESERIGYRYRLWQMLTDAGYTFEFVGSMYQGWDYIPDPQDCHHEGHGGWTDSQIRDNIIGWLNSTPADIILLHIGTNALNPSPLEVEQILDNIDTWEAANNPVWVVLARIINRSSSESLPDPDYIGTSSTTTQFNDNVQAMAEARITGGDQIVIVDIENGEQIDYRRQPAGDMWESPDTLHPNEYGYTKMAHGWYKALQNLMPTPPVTCSASISHYWRMEETIRPFTDNAGFSVMYAPDPPVQVAGRVGSAQLFSGAEECSIRDDDSFDWAQGDDWTIEFWMKKDNPIVGSTTNDNEVIVGRDDPSTDLHWWIGPCATVLPKGAACFQLRDSGHNGDALYGTTDLDDGGWHHVVAVREGSTNWNRLYVDGGLEAEDQFTYAAGFAGDGVPMDIGWLNLNPYYNYDGIVDELAIHDAALTLPEIIEHYTNGLVGKGYCNGGDVAPTITSSAVTVATVGQLYSYDVSAIGFPAPTFALTVQPAGMTIDPVTGLIQWIPPDTTDVPVTVEATNLEGTDSQSFTIVVQEAPDCPAGMTAYWQLEETSGATYDDIYDGHDGNASPNAPAPDSGGIVGGCQDFNGTDNWFDVPDHADFDWSATASFTIETWAKFTNVSNRNKVMIGRDQGGGSPHWWLGAQQNTGLVVFNLRDTGGNGEACYGTTAINDGQWHHIVAVRDESVNRNRIYVDGAPEDSVTFDYTAGFGASTPLGIGYMAYNFTPDYFYDGLLDEIAIYSRVLTQSEIAEHHANGLAGQGYCLMEPAAPQIISTPVTAATVGQPYSYDVNATGYPAPTYALTTAPAGMTIDMWTGLIEWTPPDTNDVQVTVEASNSAKGIDSQSFTIIVGDAPACPPSMVSYWKFDETSGSSYEDFFGGNDAGSGNPPTPVTGQVDGAQEFNGSSHQINAPASSGYNWNYNDSFSIEYWLKTPSASTAAGNEVLVGRDDSGSSLHWWTGLWDGGTASLVLTATNGDGSGSGNYLYGTTDLTDGLWHHVVAVRKASADSNLLYVDGVQEAGKQVSYTAGGSFSSASASINMGWLNLGGGYYFQGTLDEIAIYDDALTPAEVSDHYQNGLAGMGYCQMQSQAPVITSTPVTTATAGQLYSYDVNATGYPAPTYSLTTSPVGMTIDPASGLIEWTPSAAGDEEVTVAATNSAKAVDTQNFTINVAEAPDCPLGMIAYWELEETSGASYADTYDGHDGNGSATPPTPDAGGIVGGCQSFNGSNNYIDVPDHADFDWSATASFTIEVWMKFTDISGDNKVAIGRDQGGGYPHWWLGANAGSGTANFNLLDTTRSGPACTGSAALNNDVWHHLVAVRDESENENRLYVDGACVDSVTYDYAAGFEATTPIGMGYMAYNYNPGYHYSGLLDEVALYNRALSAVEILDHYNDGLAGDGYCQPPGPAPPVIVSEPDTTGMVGQLYSYDVDATGNPAPIYNLTTAPAGMTIDPNSGLIEWTPAAAGDEDVTVIATNTAKGIDTQSFTIHVAEGPDCPLGMTAYWRLEETSGTTYDDHYDGHDGSASPSPPAPDAGGIVGGCQDFDGTGNWIDVPDHADFDWSATASFTVELWAKFTNVASRNKVMIGRDQGGGSPHWWLGAQQSTGLIVFNLRDSGGNGAACTGASAINNDEWHHIVAVRDESENENRIYVDGAPEDSVTFDYTAGFDAATPLGIGYMAYNYTPDYFYDGLLDEIAIYNRVLTPGEIQTHYTEGLAGNGYCLLSPEPPIITTEPDTTATVGMLFTYDVDATGNPAPTFGLTVSPAGMTIDPGSGLIEWTPAAAGDEDVTVVATNTAKATDSQSFTIHVAEAPDCPAGVVHYYELDESASPYVDLWGGNDAGCTFCPAPVAGQVGGGQWFDGTDDEVDAPDNDTMEWLSDASFSIACWMKTGESTSGNRVIVGRDAIDTQLHWWVGCADGGEAHFGLKDNDAHYEGCTGTTIVNNDDWHFVVAVRDESENQNRIYVDGELENTVTYDYTGDFTGNAALNLGYLNLAGHYRYHGAVDDVAVYDVALDSTTIHMQYVNGLQGHGPCELFAPVFVSSPPDTAWMDTPFSYDCDAAGNPAPSYSLVTGPAGMTIDPVSGLVEWTPPNPADADITVQATNSEGSPTHQYHIVVLAPVGVAGDVPGRHFLAANKPNPFNPMTTISFGMPIAGHARLTIFDVTGRKVVTLADQVFEAGVQELIWMGKDESGAAVSSGIYFYRLETDEFSQTKKMTLLK